MPRTIMGDEEIAIWRYLIANRQAAPAEVAKAVGVNVSTVNDCIARISSENWREPINPRHRHVGESDYSTKTIQPWDIWYEYKLNPWDADIVKRVLRSKPGQRRLDYEKIIHVCEERIRQIDEESKNARVANKKSARDQEPRTSTPTQHDPEG